MKRLYEEYWSRERPPPTTDPLAPARRRLLWTHLAHVQPRDRRLRLLDCGSGDGALVAEAAARGVDAVGLEISDAAIERAKATHPNGAFVQHSLEERPWPVEPESFDCAVSFEVIEHLLQPEQLLLGARDALRPGGHIAVSTPYHGRVKNIAIALVAFDRHFDVRGDHVRFFSDGSLRRLLEDCGFAVENIEHLGRGPGVWANVFVWARRW